MEANYIDIGMKFISTQGTVLSPREQVCLSAGLTKLRNDEKYSNVFFWGRVNGDEDDYYVAFGLQDGKAEFPLKKFYWTTSEVGFAFSELPFLTAEEAKLAAVTEKGTFRGKPGRTLGTNGTAEEEEAPVDPAAEEGAPPPPKPLRVTELQRLAYVVRQADHETSVVPYGAFVLNDRLQVTSDRLFRGLSFAEAAQISNYGHFRPASDVAALKAMAADDALFQTRFLDPIESDLPLGCWTLRFDDSSSYAVVRSLLWPGYCAYHVPGTRIFGGAYFGDGLRTNDLAFLL